MISIRSLGTECRPLNARPVSSDNTAGPSGPSHELSYIVNGAKSEDKYLEERSHCRERRGKSFWGGRFCKKALPRPLPKNSYMAGGTTNAHVGAHGCAP